MQIELDAGLRADLAAAAEDADAYHHDLCQVFAEDAPGVCSCAGPRLLRRLAAALEVGWLGPALETSTPREQAA